MPPPDPEDKSPDGGPSGAGTPGAPAVRPGTPPVRPGAGRYEERGPLGKGSMGEVVLCRDTRIGRDVALKRLAARRVGEGGARTRFLREARVQGQLEHPAVVPVYDLDADVTGSDFFTMKCLRGQTLAEIIDALRRGDEDVRARFPLRRLLGALSAACLAVDFAHSRGVIHRDLKPANVMLGEYGEVYVLDWGIAKLAGPGEALALPEDVKIDTARTQAGKILGTWGYMSPEQARGRVERIDARSDVYALGAVLFEMLALEPLHKKDMWNAMLMATVQGVSAVASERAPGRDVPPELDAVCVKATALDPNDRYQTAREVHEALERFLQGDRDVETRRNLAASHARAADEAMRRAAGGGAHEAAAARAALADAGRALALEPTNAEALRVVAAVLSATPREIPGDVRFELDAHARARHRLQLREAIAADVAGIVMMTPIVLWMGLRSYWAMGAAVTFTLGSTAVKVYATRRKRLKSLYPAAFASFLLNVLALMCLSAGFGPLLFVPGLFTAFTFGYCMTNRAGYRLAVIVTGVLAILISFGAELVGIVPPSYAFHDGAMTILPRGVTLSPFPTIVALLVSSVFMVIVPGVLMGRLQGVLRHAEERAFLQTWRLRNLLPDEAAGLAPGPESTTGRRVLDAPAEEEKSP